MDDQNSPIFTQAKLEYTKQLIDILSPQLFDGIKSIYDEAKTVNRVNRRQSITLLYREFLEKVPSWSNVLIEAEAERIIKMSICDWMDDLITAVFISHTKILTSIGVNTSNNTIDLVIPKITTFIHKCYINIAREMWKNPYFFTENVVSSEYQKNMRIVEITIKECIENTIRQLLPIKEILKQNLEKNNTKKIENENIKPENIKELLLKEIQNLDLLNLIKSSSGELNNNDINRETINDVVDNVVDHVVELDGEDDNVVEDNDLEDNDVEDNEGYTEPTNTLPINDEDDYVSVDEETIQKNCENLEINTLDDKNDKEEIYDNANIIDRGEKESPSLLEKFIENLSTSNDINDNGFEDNQEYNDVTEENKISKNIIENIEDILDDNKEKTEQKSNITKIVPEPKPIKELEEEDNFDINDISKKNEKELISVEKISDTETVDEFFNDVSNMIEKKTGMTINKSPRKYTLFEDANNSE